MTGTLYGVGTGPGDPELMTLKAHRLIGAAQVVAYPTLPHTDSLARRIAADAISPDALELALPIPMTVDRAPAQAAYDAAAEVLGDHLRAGRDVVVLCEGDPFFYGSFMYLFARLSQEFQTEVVPGVSSVMACSALAHRPLVARNEVLTVLPGPMPTDDLVVRLVAADTAVIMKVGRHLPRLRAVLSRLNLLDKTIYVERAGLPDERWMPLADAPESAPYFSMLLVTKGADPWL